MKICKGLKVSANKGKIIHIRPKEKEQGEGKDLATPAPPPVKNVQDSLNTSANIVFPTATTAAGTVPKTNPNSATKPSNFATNFRQGRSLIRVEENVKKYGSVFSSSSKGGVGAKNGSFRAGEYYSPDQRKKSDGPIRSIQAISVPFLV